jgi:hypothetical protein
MPCFCVEKFERRRGFAGEMHRFMVNIKSASIFKGILETQKSAVNLNCWVENFAEIARCRGEPRRFKAAQILAKKVNAVV